jgi:hypothetical protein
MPLFEEKPDVNQIPLVREYAGMVEDGSIPKPIMDDLLIRDISISKSKKWLMLDTRAFRALLNTKSKEAEALDAYLKSRVPTDPDSSPVFPGLYILINSRTKVGFNVELAEEHFMTYNNGTFDPPGNVLVFFLPAKKPTTTAKPGKKEATKRTVQQNSKGS